MNTKRDAICLGLVCMLAAGCAGRADMQNVAAHSATILSHTQSDVVAFNETQTSLNNIIQDNIASFSTMTSAANLAVKTRQATSIDPKMQSLFQEMKSSDPSIYIASADDATAAIPNGPVVNVGTEKLRASVAALNALAQDPSLKSQVTFLVEFAKGVKDAYDAKQKKAQSLADAAKDNAKSLSPAANAAQNPQAAPN